MLVCYSAYFVRNSSIYFHLRNGCMEQNFSERRAFLYEYDVFLFKKYVRRKGICWRLISFPFPLKTMWTPKSSSPLLTPLFRKNTRWWSLFLFSKIFWLTSAILIEMMIFNMILCLPIMTFTEIQCNFSQKKGDECALRNLLYMTRFTLEEFFETIFTLFQTCIT